MIDHKKEWEDFVKASIKDYLSIPFIKYKLKYKYYGLMHLLSGKHHFAGQSLVHVDGDSYPYCDVCGASPKENYHFQWYNRKHLDIRDRLLGQGKYEN